MSRNGKILSAVVVAILVALGIWAIWFNGSNTTTHKATCWAHPGVIGYVAPGRFVAVLRASGTRHGKGPVGSDVCDK